MDLPRTYNGFSDPSELSILKKKVEFYESEIQHLKKTFDAYIPILKKVNEDEDVSEPLTDLSNGFIHLLEQINDRFVEILNKKEF